MTLRPIACLLPVMLLTVSGCLRDENLKIAFDISTVDTGDGWQLASPASQGFNEARLQGAIRPYFDEDRFVTAISLVVVRNGKLVAEAYVRDHNDRYEKRQIQSVTKCITSLVFGIARDLGCFGNLDQRLVEIVPEAFDGDSRKREITLRHLLTMNSGLTFSNDDFADELFMKDRKGVMRYILSKPLFASPGETYDYRDCDPQLLSGAIHTQSGLALDRLADIELFGPMGITDYFWERNEDGDSWASEALFMRPRDLAKIGQLVLNEGVWNGESLVSNEWIALSTSTQSDPNVDQPVNDRMTFGFYWRLQPHRVAIEANGAGGQQILIVPEKNLVIVFTCEPYVDGEYSLAGATYSIAQGIIDSIEE